MIITKINFGIKEETVSPYIDDINRCLCFGFRRSILIFKTKIAVTNPKVNIQKSTWILVLKNIEESKRVIS